MRCETCAFWEEHGASEAGWLEGSCHRYPPTPMAVFEPAAQKSKVYHEFPLTADGEWCGEWQEKAS